LCHSCEVNLYNVKFLSDGTRTSHVKTTSHNATFGKTRHVQCTMYVIKHAIVYTNVQTIHMYIHILFY